VRRTAGAVFLSAAAIAAALGLGACGADTEPQQPEATTEAAAPIVGDQVPAEPPAAPLPPPSALADVMNRIADANVPGGDKTALIESAAPGDAAAMDRFGQALNQNGYRPLNFEARDLRWIQGAPGTVSAVISLKSANPQAGDFSYPMEFILTDNAWQLARQSADELLQPEADAPQTPTAPTPPREARRRMWIGWLEFDLLLGDVHSLKQKRSVIRPVIAELHRRFAVSAAETGSLDLHRRAGVGIAVVSAERGHVVDVLDAAERLVAARPELELLSARRGLRRSTDD
jgi:uncharacterized protein YlxP (DUF503 family)